MINPVLFASVIMDKEHPESYARGLNILVCCTKYDILYSTNKHNGITEIFVDSCSVEMLSWYINRSKIVLL